MPGIHTPVETIKTSECEDGYELHYRVWLAGERPVSTLFLLNGMMSHSAWFEDVAHALAELQIKVVGADRRGSGLNQRDRGDAPSRQLLLSDLQKVIEHEDCGAPTYILGWCWGAVLAVNAALQLNTNVSGVVLLAPGLFPSEQINRIVRKGLAALDNGNTNACYLHSPITPEMFTDNIEVQDFIRRDPLALHVFTSRFFRISEHMMFVAATRLAQIKQRLLVLLATKDVTVNNDRTTKALQTLPAGAMTVAVLNCNHGMQFEAPQQIVAHISAWI